MINLPLEKLHIFHNWYWESKMYGNIVYIWGYTKALMYREVEILGSCTQKFQFITSGGCLWLCIFNKQPWWFCIGGSGTTCGEGWLCNSPEIVTEPSSACHPLLAQLLLNILQQRSLGRRLSYSLISWDTFWVIRSYDS